MLEVYMAATIKDIARKTGLSTATVSKYLNKLPVKEENRKLIEEAILELQYRPNSSARALRAGRETTICIIMSDLGNYFWAETLLHITQYFTRNGFTVINRSYFFEQDKEEELIRDLIAQRVSGVVLMSNTSKDHLYTLLQEAQIPVVVLDKIPFEQEKYPVDCVLSDNYAGGAMLAEYLLENGHKDVCIMSEYSDFYSISTRIKGFSDTFRKAGIDLSRNPWNRRSPLHYISSSQIQPAACEEFRQLLAMPKLPTAVFFTTYEIAIGALSDGNAARIEIPGEISMVTFDDDILFRSLKFSMSCVEQNMVRLGTEASALLLRRIRGDWDDFPIYKYIDVVFHPRKSVRNIKTV